MRTIVIDEEVETLEDMIFVMENITEQLKNGITSGIEPSFSLEGEDEYDELQD